MAINRIKTGGITDGTIQSGDLAPGTVASDRIAPGTIANDRLANNTITINGTSIALGASGDIVAGTDWQAVTVADGSTTVNTVAGGGYLLDTNAGIIEAFLPSSPTRGDTVVIADYSGTFATNKCIVNTGGVNIDSTVGSEFQLTTNNTIAEFIYIDSSKGWLVKLNQAAGTTPSSALTGGNVYDTAASYISATGGTITTSGDFKIHTFTGDGCFVVSSLGGGATPCAVASTVDYLVVAGGGAAGTCTSGGGGAGGYRESKDSTLNSPHTASPLAATTGLTITATTYPVTVGAGGAGTTNSANPAETQNGSNSIFSTITSAGGGGSKNADNAAGAAGGSGGGGGYPFPGSLVQAPDAFKGAGNTPPTSPPQGNPGGRGYNAYAPFSPPSLTTGGGGGAGAAGQNGGPTGAGGIISGKGGDGVGTEINPSPSVGTPGPSGPLRYFAGGGAGGAKVGATTQPGGTGGGGNSGPAPTAGTSGSANTGGGAGGHSDAFSCASGSGGKGIVIIRYKYQ